MVILVNIEHEITFIITSAPGGSLAYLYLKFKIGFDLEKIMTVSAILKEKF